MLYIEKNTENTYITELTSVSSLSTPNYLFELVSDITSSDVTYFNVTDLSTFKCRYNRFDIIESGSTFSNLTASTVNLRTGGYRLNVYEAPTPTLEVSATTGTIIYTGKALVSGTDNDILDIYK
jgi:hypothetical protein